MLLESIQVEGYVLIPDVLDSTQILNLTEDLTKIGEGSAKRGGQRNLLEVLSISELAQSNVIRSLVTPILGEDAFVLRGILFDKTEEANWKVPWHQDVTIAVKDRVDLDGFGPWSTKQGVLHVQPPSCVLEKMLSVRIHLDDCPATNGALRVLPRTHQQGKLDESLIAETVSRGKPVICEIDAGGALLMRPLLLHSSSASETARHRRVVHLDYANASLPSGLSWYECFT